jgi:hypothetical protein
MTYKKHAEMKRLVMSQVVFRAGAHHSHPWLRVKTATVMQGQDQPAHVLEFCKLTHRLRLTLN